MVVATYFGKLKVLWDELANSDKIPSCTCGGCKCGIGAQLEKRREEEKVHQLLMGLDDASYGTVRSNILASDPLPSLNRVYAMLVQEERLRMMAKSTEERGLVVGLAMHANYKEKGRGDMVEKLMTCSHCGKNGHDMKGCFQLIGYPEWWGDKPKSEGKWNGRGRQGMRNKGNPTRANVAHASGSNSQANNDDKKLEMAGLTNEQWKVLVDMISKQKSNESEKMTVASSNLDECIVNQPIASPIPAKEDATLTDDFDHTINDSDPCIEASTLPADPPSRPTETAPSVSSPPLTAAVPLGRGHRAKLPSVRLRDFVAATTIPSSPSVPSPPSTESSGVSYPIHDFVNCDSFSKHHQSFLASLHTEQEPLFFSQAVREPRWRDAMAQEIHALELNDTWKLTALPPGKKALGCKWIYKIKYNSDGTIERFKARLLVVLVYVDDLVIAGNNGTAIQCFKGYLNQCFHMKDLGRLKYFLGVEVVRSPNGIFLCQRKYALDIITEVGLLGAKPATTPCEENHKLSSATGSFLSDPATYRRLVGRVSQCKSAKEMWDTLEVTHEGNNEVKRARNHTLIQEYEMFRMLKGETIAEVTAISESKDLTSLSMASLFGKLREHELEMNRLNVQESEDKNVKSIALKAVKHKGKQESNDDSDEENLSLLSRNCSLSQEQPFEPSLATSLALIV
ncbi:uncharacterized protein [Phaseolus vulgaris]|uniref:uncharacterized protein n=1 Tax=Phaseolus vulgaris TaxID=3885 RepID=UPI0035CA6EC9